MVLCRAPVPNQPPSSRAAKKLCWVWALPRPTGESFLNTCMLFEKERSVDCILSNRLVRFSSLGSERTISSDINTNLKHLQAGSREKERSGLMSFLLMPQVNEQPRVLLRLRTEMLFFFFLNPSVSHIPVWRRLLPKLKKLRYTQAPFWFFNYRKQGGYKK